MSYDRRVITDSARTRFTPSSVSVGAVRGREFLDPQSENRSYSAAIGGAGAIAPIAVARPLAQRDRDRAVLVDPIELMVLPIP